MNWNEKAIRAARGAKFAVVERCRFRDGARWQRNQLRTDEAVERVAKALYVRNFIDPDKGERRWKAMAADGKRFRIQHARASIAALIGEA